MKIREIAAFFERLAPLMYQESYDNSGLQIGNYTDEVEKALITLDVTEDVLQEAIDKGCGLIIAHHPLIFGGLKSITGKNMVERIVAGAIRNNIAIYAIHTNLDSIVEGVSGKMCEMLDLKKCKVLDPVQGKLKKLVVFVPADHAAKLRQALFDAGAGQIGNYDSCSFNLDGTGTFRGGDETNPYSGTKGELSAEPEVRVETIFPEHLKGRVVTALLSEHPYEEVAYDIYPLDNKYPLVGMGMIGELQEKMSEEEFMGRLRKIFKTGVIKHSAFRGKPVKKVALCGGAGSGLLRKAIAEKADFFVSGDFKYHQFFEAEGKLVIADIGHFESEQYTRELIYDLLTKNFPKFAVQLSEVNTNPIKYF